MEKFAVTKTLIYLHGLGSSGSSPKIDAIREVLENNGIKVLSPDLPLDPDEAVNVVKKLVHELYDSGQLEKLIFCGTSLGGFYASYFGERYDSPYVIINPAIKPSATFEKYASNPPTSFMTGKPLPFTEELIKKFTHFEIKKPTGYLANVFVAKNDAVISYIPTLDLYKYASLLHVSNTGGHRYDSEMPRVISHIRNLFL